MTMVLLAIALMGQLLDKEETSSLKCFNLDDNQRVCIEEQENPQAAMQSDEFLIEEVKQNVVFDI